MRALLLMLLLVPLSSPAEDRLPPSITVHGEAVTKVTPDQVTLPITIREENANVKMAKEKHDAKLRTLLKLAVDTGIEKNDIQTSYTSVSPQYDYSQNQRPRLRGYQVETSIEFTLNDIPKLAEFMDGVIGLGITDMGSVSYSLKNEDKVKEDTLAKAMTQAHEKAALLASAANVSLDRPLDIEEGEPMVTRPFLPRPMFARAMAGASMNAPAAPDLPEGVIEIRQSVTVTYQLK